MLPSFGPSAVMPQAVLDHGAMGISWLRPQALFGAAGMDPVVHAVMWSMLLNTTAFVITSILSFPKPIERLQGAQFVDVFQHSATARTWSGGLAQSEDLLIMSQRIMGPAEAQAFFSGIAREQGLEGYLPEPSPDFLQALERKLSGSIGAAAAHAMISQIVGGATVSVEDLMAVADETAQIMEYSSRLEAKTEEQARTARQLREANEKLTQLSVQKDGFLSQISHELRTPMTSIRAFSEILRDTDDLTLEEQKKYASVIHDETIRLTRLLDDLLDLSVLENGQVVLNEQTDSLSRVLDRAEAAAGASLSDFRIFRNREAEDLVLTNDLDRLAQVFINLINNARKYCDAPHPALTITSAGKGDTLEIDFVDNGSGIPTEQQAMIFEKFSRIAETRAGGAGLGLAICREIMGRLGGSISYLPGQGGAAFRVTVPVRMPAARRATAS
jgi:signal transduction histidine kinase